MSGVLGRASSAIQQHSADIATNAGNMSTTSSPLKVAIDENNCSSTEDEEER